ncbi:ABC transporter substrate-binding protein [Orbaceae bacterium ac157xtp]
MSNISKYKRKLAMGVGLVTLAASFQLQAAGTFVYCSEASPEIFNPQLVTSGTSMDASAVPLYNRLLEFKLGTTEVIPGLAKSWDISDDRMTYTFHLRDDVKWHSNKEFKATRNLNADDVIFSFMRQKDANHPYHKVSGGQYEYFESMGLPELIKEIKKIDDYTVQFQLNQPEAPFLADLAMSFSSILSAEYADAMLKKGTPEKVDLMPIGTGPFTFVQYQKDSRILYKANPDYFGSKAKVDRLVFSITPDAAIRYAKLQKGECHAMPYPNLADVERMKADKNIVVGEMAGSNIGYMSYNMNKPPLDNLQVRQALNMAVNKQAIIDAIFQGAAEPAKNFIPPSMWGYNNEIKDYPYDPEQAKDLLKAAGLEKGFSLTLWAMPVQRPYNPNARRMAEMIQADWAKVGVNAKIVTYEWGEYLSRIRESEHDTVLIGWSGDNGDPDNFYTVLFSCDAVKAGQNYSNWCYKPFDDLLKQARVESDHQKRVDLYKQAQVEMHDQAPALLIAHSMVYMPVRKEVKGFIMDPLGLHNFNEVSIEK